VPPRPLNGRYQGESGSIADIMESTLLTQMDIGFVLLAPLKPFQALAALDAIYVTAHRTLWPNAWCPTRRKWPDAAMSSLSLPSAQFPLRAILASAAN